jgi:flagellar biosynthesis/type III secretory pathway chaperone
LLDDLLHCLRDESKALAAGDASGLPQLAARKGELLAQLSAALRDAKTVRRHAATLRQIQALNDRNAQLLAPRLTMNRAAVAALWQAAGGAVYGADGQTAPATAAMRAYARA